MKTPKRSRFIFVHIKAVGFDDPPNGYIVLSRKTGRVLGNVWTTYDPYSITTKRGWCAYGKSGHVYRTRLDAAKALLPY